MSCFLIDASWQKILAWDIHLADRLGAGCAGGGARPELSLFSFWRPHVQAPCAKRRDRKPIDTTSAAGKAFLSMLGVFAEFETNLRRERQLEGIAAAKARGVYKGRLMRPRSRGFWVKAWDLQRSPSGWGSDGPVCTA